MIREWKATLARSKWLFGVFGCKGEDRSVGSLEGGIDGREDKGCFIRRLRTQLILSGRRPAAAKALLINSEVYI